MKKIVLLSTWCLLSYASGNAQTLAESIRQKETERRYLLQQIAALQAYERYARKGYGIANEGISSVWDVKQGEFSLYEEFISRLKKASPSVGSYVRVGDIMACQVRILKQTAATTKTIKDSGELSATEWKQYDHAIQALLKDCNATIESLILIITKGELTMSDAERLRHVDRLYLDMQSKYAIWTAFTQEAKLLCRQKLTERSEINYLRMINGLK